MTTDPMSPPSPPSGDAVLAACVTQPRKPWGFWATIGLSLLVLIAYAGCQIAALFAWLAASLALDPQQSPLERIAAAPGSDVVMAAATWASSLGGAAILALCVLPLRPRWSLREYVGLKSISLRSAAVWSGVVVVAAVAADLLTVALGADRIPKEFLEVYRNAACPPLLVSAILIAAPWFEEVFFRGFFLRGVAASRLGAAGAVLLASALWTSLHYTYPPVHLGVVFSLGLLLGAVRLRTGSVSVTILMHAVWNAISTAEVYWFLYTTS